MKISIYLAVIILLLASTCFSQEPPWLAKIKQIEPLKSTEKDVERIFGEPTERFRSWSQYKLEEGIVRIFYSEGKCAANGDSNYDVEKGTVVEISFYTPKDIKFNSLNVNLIGFKKENSGDAYGAFYYKNKALGISYDISNDRLVGITIDPAENYAYLACSKKQKEPEPITDDVNPETLVKLTQLKVLQNTLTDVAALFGAPFKSREDVDDFYMGEGYAIGFTYSSGKCSLSKEDIWNVPKGKIIKIVIIFADNGVASTLDLGKLSRKEDKEGFSFYADNEEGVEYKIKDNRIWRIQYEPGKKYIELKCNN